MNKLQANLVDEQFSIRVIRRLAKRHGLTMVRGRGQFSVSNHLQFMLLDSRNRIIGGPRYDMTPDEVFEYITELRRTV